MTGLEIMEAIVREELPHPTMTKSIPVKVMNEGRKRKGGFQCYRK